MSCVLIDHTVKKTDFGHLLLQILEIWRWFLGKLETAKNRKLSRDRILQNLLFEAAIFPRRMDPYTLETKCHSRPHFIDGNLSCHLFICNWYETQRLYSHPETKKLSTWLFLKQKRSIGTECQISLQGTSTFTGNALGMNMYPTAWMKNI